MRDYAKVSPHFWTGSTGKQLRQSPEGMIVAMYLMTSPHANMLGLYYVPLLYLAHETGLGLEGASKGLEWAKTVGFCSYDPDSEMVWVHEMARFQVADELKVTDNRCKGIQNEYSSLPSNPYLESFYDKYHQVFCMTKKRENSSKKVSPYEAPQKPLVSQEQEQEQEQENNICPSNDEPVPEQANQNFKNEIQEIFEFWKTTFGKNDRTKLDNKRKSKILTRLREGYSVEEIKNGVMGCSKSDHHVQGQFTDIELICRDAVHLDRFIGYSQQIRFIPKTPEPERIDLSKYKVVEDRVW